MRARTAERAVAQQNLDEGQVLAPVAGRVHHGAADQGHRRADRRHRRNDRQQPFLLRLRMPGAARACS